MLGAILHVEDDLALRSLVGLAFQSFGFRGTVLTADSVAEAIERLDAARESGSNIDLILSDMSLPDGAGLDVVRHVRSSPRWMYTPVLILSGDVNPKTVGRAYALGANAYLDKSPRGRTLSDVIKSLYEHWCKDVRLPHVQPLGAIHHVLTEAIEIHTRMAQLFRQMADKFGDRPEESAFWLTRTLAESNLINLVGFIRNQVDDNELPDFDATDWGQLQVAVRNALTTTERALAQDSIARVEAYRYIVDLVATIRPDIVARTLSQLFPVVPTATEALRDFVLGMLDDVATWMELHVDDPAVRERVSRLRAIAGPIAAIRRDSGRPTRSPSTGPRSA
jgi:two-component system response regulator